MDGWIGVDFDGTLAVYEGWKGAHHTGKPIPRMVNRVRRWLSLGYEVKIFTARVSDDADKLVATAAIQQWCERQFGVRLEVTNIKDFQMVELWDDRAVQVEKNTGMRMGYSTRQL